MDEDPAVAEIPSVSKVDTADYVETEEPPKLIELKPVSYDLGDVPNNNTDAFDRMDIDNHNVDFDQEDGKTTSVDDTVVETSDPNSVDESVDAKESTPKVNGVLKHSGTVKKADKKPIVTSPSSTPGKSRYGRVRKPKLSTDFVSMDRKSFAVLSNTSSYEHVYADETPRKAVVVKKPRKSSAKNSLITPSEPVQSVESLTKQSDEETGCKAESVDETDTPKTVESSSNTPKPDEIISKAPKLAKSTPKLTKSTSLTPKITKSTSQTPKPTKTASKSPRSAKSKPPKTTKPLKEDSTEPSVSPVISKDPIKTYSRKGESSAAASVTEDNQTEKLDEEKLSQISHVELNWKVGDVAWAKIGCYSYWPSIVTLEYGSSIYVKSVGNRRLAVHVQFFGDRGRRSWVLTTSLIKYQSKEQFLDLKKQYKKDKIRFKYFVIKSSFQDLWEKAVTEADTVLKLPHEERIPYYQSLYPIAEKNFVVETSSLKSKRAMIRKSKNPEERRGRKRKILNDAATTSALKKPRQTASESGPSGAGDEKLPNTETSAVKKRQPIDEHVKKRRAFMRRMNKILSQSNNNGNAKNKKPKNGLKQGGKNAKFNKLLDKENERKKQQKLGEDQTASSSTSPDSDPKKKDISVYDFESDEETDVFIGTYNSRFTPQILAKIEEEKAAVKDESKEPSTAEPESELSVTDDSKAEDGNLSNNEIKARRLFADDKKQPKDTDYVRPKGTASKFSKLFEQRHSATGRGRGRPSKISAHRSKLTHAKAARKIIRKKGAQSKAPPPEILPVEKKDTDDEREVGDFNAFRDQMTEKVSVEHPEFNEEQVEDHLEKLWSEMDDAEKIKYIKVERESSSDDGDAEVGVIEEDAKSSGNENDDDSSKSDEKRRSSSPSSTTLPSSSKPKKLSNLFTGYKTEKVCQICEKPGDTVRCRGPCAGTFHVECVQKLAAAKDTDSAVNSPPRRGRRKKSSLRPTGEATATVESTKNDAKPEPTVVNKTEEPVTSRRSRRSIAAANTSEDSSEKSKNEESVKPTPRRSRRMEEKIKNAADKVQQNDEEVKSESDNSAEEKMETEDEPISNSAANVDDESSAESAAKDGEVSKEPSTNDDEIKQENVEDPEQSAEIENNNVVDEVKTEKLHTEVSIENEIVDEKPDCNGDASEEVEVVASSSRKSSGKSVESQNTTDASKKETSTAKNDKSNGGSDFMCNLCSEGIMYPCFACGETVQDKTGETERFTCHLSSCARVFHKECLKSWPQATWTTNNPKPKNGSSSTTLKETLLCPQHYCHTCISDNPAALKNRQGQAKLVRCIKCPTTYHQNVYCIPAGSELLTMSQIICPRHYVPPKLKSTHVNTSWCFICCIGGSLICCEECPMSFHVECLQLSPEEYEGRYLCEDCQSGRYLLYGEIVWVKLGHYRWWPAHILYPQEIPDKIAMKPHNRGEFAVRFFGSHDYYWVNRGRTFVYQEGDSGKKNYNRTVVDLTFEKALKEAEEAYQKLKIDKALREEEAKLGLKPPRYVRIKSNKPIGNVKVVELNTSNIPECRCDPNSERPCAPESDCLNRILLVECNPRVCAAGERCLNQAFEKRVYPPLMPCRTDKRGWGLKTLVDIKKGDFIIEYVGEMIDEEEYKKRVGAMYKNLEENYYFLTIDNNRMLDAGPKGNVSRFMNHSCDPNCETQKWTVNGDTRIGLFALKDITANDELVFNYNLTVLGNEKKPCLCGSEKCSGFIGMKAVKNGNGNNGGGSNGDDDSRKKSNDDNRDSKNGGGNGSKSSRARKKGRKLTAAGKRKRKAAMAKRASTAAASSSTLPIKKRKLSTKADTTAETSTNPDEETSKQNPQQPDTDETETNPVEQSSTDELVKILETDPTSAATTAEEDQPIAASSPKGTENATNEGEKNTTEYGTENATNEGEKNTTEYGTDEEHTISLEDIETVAETTVAIEVPKTDVSDENTTSVTVKSSPKRRGRKKGTVLKKKVAVKGRPKKKVMPKRLLKRGKNIMVKKTKKTTDGAKKSPKIKVKTAEDRVVGKRGRKPHLTDQDKELALYKTLKKRLHKKLRAMVGLAKLEEDCFMCKEKGELIFCDNKKCSKGYHIPCVKKLFQLPRGRWLCPWHYCTECKSKCRVAKCSRCINSYCRLHTENNVYITCEDTLICKDHKSEYLADKLQSFVNVSDTSTDNDSSNITDASTQIIDPDSLLIPLRIPQPKPRPKLIHKPPPQAILHHQIHHHHHEHLLPPFIKIKEEALSDVEIDSEPDRIPAPAIVGESRNVARRSKKLFMKLPSVNESSIDDMIIDDFIEVHHVESYEVSGNEASNDDAKSIDSSVEVEVEVDEEYEEEEEEEQPETNTADESDDDYLDVEMEEIQDDSS